MTNLCEDCLYMEDAVTIKARKEVREFELFCAKLCDYCNRLMPENFAAALGLKVFALHLYESGDTDTLLRLEECVCGLTPQGETEEGTER